jgi:predicted lysophospholipase L1 biosynthesis ABC-type transport system permease subunit
LNKPGIKPAEIIGVVSQVKHYGLDGEVPVENQFYLPLAQIPPQILPVVVRRLNVMLRVEGDPLGVATAARGQVQALNPNQPVFNVMMMEQRVSRSITGQRFSMVLLSLFAGLALVLAAVGIYGVMSSIVEQRTHEIGIRLALGAQKRDVLVLVARQGLTLAVIGVTVGVIASLALTRLMATLLSGVSVTDPLTYTGVAALLVAVAALACYLPARRAMKTDTLVALRYE